MGTPEPMAKGLGVSAGGLGVSAWHLCPSQGSHLAEQSGPCHRRGLSHMGREACAPCMLHPSHGTVCLSSAVWVLVISDLASWDECVWMRAALAPAPVPPACQGATAPVSRQWSCWGPCWPLGSDPGLCGACSQGLIMGQMVAGVI